MTRSTLFGLFTDLVADHATDDRAADRAYPATACEHGATDRAYPGTRCRIDASLGHAGATGDSRYDKER